MRSAGAAAAGTVPSARGPIATPYSGTAKRYGAPSVDHCGASGEGGGARSAGCEAGDTATQPSVSAKPAKGAGMEALRKGIRTVADVRAPVVETLDTVMR